MTWVLVWILSLTQNHQGRTKNNDKCELWLDLKSYFTSSKSAVDGHRIKRIRYELSEIF